MKSIEAEAEIDRDGKVTLRLPRDISFVPGIQKIILIIQEVEEIQPETEFVWKEELDKRLERMEKNPHPGFTMEDVALELEETLGRKIQARARS
jgi:hypothetical protein